MASDHGFETRLLLTDGRVVPAALLNDGSAAFISAWVDTPQGRRQAPPQMVLPYRQSGDATGFILSAAQRARITNPR